jgi:hypothetical protein
MKPTIGRIVYYKGLNDILYAALVHHVFIDKENEVDLTVFYPDGPKVVRLVSQGNDPGTWDWMPYQKGQTAKTEELEKKISEKDMGITEVRGAKANISDLQVYGDGDTFALLCKASSQSQGWMKSTKVCNVFGGCIVQVTTQQRNPDGSHAVAEALTFVPGVHIDASTEPRRLVPELTSPFKDDN